MGPVAPGGVDRRRARVVAVRVLPPVVVFVYGLLARDASLAQKVSGNLIILVNLATAWLCLRR